MKSQRVHERMNERKKEKSKKNDVIKDYNAYSYRATLHAFTIKKVFKLKISKNEMIKKCTYM